jgi:4a-hydroxytetrahydrobiopterin dehydratase
MGGSGIDLQGTSAASTLSWVAKLRKQPIAPMPLSDDLCVPCRDGGPTLGEDELAALLPELPGWQVVDHHHLLKSLAFGNFASALAWVNRAGAVCEANGHHADFKLGWGYVEVTIYTHKADGLTRADAVLAAKLDAIETAAVPAQ